MLIIFNVYAEEAAPHTVKLFSAMEETSTYGNMAWNRAATEQAEQSATQIKAVFRCCLNTNTADDEIKTKEAMQITLYLYNNTAATANKNALTITEYLEKLYALVCNSPSIFKVKNKAPFVKNKERPRIPPNKARGLTKSKKVPVKFPPISIGMPIAKFIKATFMSKDASELLTIRAVSHIKRGFSMLDLCLISKHTPRVIKAKSKITRGK